MTTYPDSVRFLYSLGNEIKTLKLGLDRISVLLAALGNPERACRHIHVAGTNGKGSTCAMIASALRVPGRRTGLFTSPHLAEPTERIQIDGRPLSSQEFAEIFEIVHRTAGDLAGKGLLDGHPTYFETVTAMGFVAFARHRVDIAVVEVGLGGRLDATNVVGPSLCVICPVDYDHQAWLGSSLTQIATEKAGILKSGVPAVIARQHPEAMAAIQERATSLGVELCSTAAWSVTGLELDPRRSRFTARNLDTELPIDCPLAGEHQVDNALAAAIALHRFGLSPGEIHAGIQATRWPGRLELVSTSPDLILDGAHNPAAARALAAYLRRFYSNRRVWIVFAAMRDKSAGEMAAALAPLAHRIILTRPASPRACDPEELRPLFDHPHVSIAPALDHALSLTHEAAPGDAVFVTGSLYLVGEARALLAPVS